MQQEPNKMKPNQKDELEKKTDNEFVRKFAEEKYKYGFTTEVHTDIIERGLNEDVIRLISSKKDEPEWLLEFRLKAYRHWLTLEMPTWAHLRIPEIDYQAISYYADPTKKKEGPKSMEEVDPELIKTFNKLGIPLEEQMALSGMAVDAVMDSVSVKTTFKETLMEKGIIFCSFSEAVREHPDLVKKYMGSVVGYRDNFFAALNSAVFSDGSFVYIPKGVRCPMELSTYFRINARNTGQFERTLIVADDDSYVSYLEGCTAPMRDENQLHAAIVEIIVHDRAEVKYSTVQNWYPGDAEGKGGVYNFVTKRGNCKGVDSKLSWTQVETGSAITWKYPSCILTGDNSTAEFYSVAVTNNYQQADTGTKMIHLGKNTRSTIVSKGISAGHSENSYRGLVRVAEKADNARNYSQCDSLLLGDKCGAHTFPYMDIHNETAVVEHEATTSKISEDQIFYCNQRGIPTEDAIGLIVNGYAKEVLNKLPMEFAVEAQKLLTISLEGSVGDVDFLIVNRKIVNIIMLEIKDLHASINGKEILKGINLTVNPGEVHAIMGPNGSGKSTLSSVLVGNPAFEVTKGSVTFYGKDLLELSPEDRSHEGIFLSFQYPVEIPGVSMVNFMRAAVNEQRKYKGLPALTASEFLKLMREKRAVVELDNKLANRSVNEGFSGGEKKRNEIFQMAMLEPRLSILDETDSGLDIDALRIVAEGVNKLKTPETSTIVITHYQRLLDYIKPDIVHVLYKGRIVKTAGPELALELEEKGYDWIKKEVGE
ncbi:Fe-S cluster assembly protein SufB [Bacteroides ovatus]|nr:Fe-S cluster assembly protein SufB [Bacteroides ovatus]